MQELTGVHRKRETRRIFTKHETERNILNMKKNSLTQKIYYSLLFPTLVTGLVMTIATFSDSIIVGNFLGEEALSAITFTLPIFMLINTLIAMITIGGAVVVSTENGKGNRELSLISISA